MQKNKIDDLSSKIEEKLNSLEKTNKLVKVSNLSIASKIATDLVAGIIVGIIIGVYLDKTLESKPLFLIISLCFGLIAGVKNIIKTLKE